MKSTLPVAAVLVLGLMIGASGGLEGQVVLSMDPAVLTVHSAVPGFPPEPATDDITTYSVEVAEWSVIEVQLDSPLPAGVNLYLRMEAPPGAASAGRVPLGTTAQALVTSIPAGSYSGLSITYEVSATVSAGVVSLDSRQVTFTVKAAS